MRDPKATKVHGTGTIQVKTYVPKPYDEPADGPKLIHISVTETFSGDIEGEGTVEFLQLLRSDGSARCRDASGRHSWRNMVRCIGVGERATAGAAR